MVQKNVNVQPYSVAYIRRLSCIANNSCSGGKALKRIQRLGFLMLFAALSQQFLHQPVVAQEPNASDKSQRWFGVVPANANNPRESNGVRGATSLNWIRLDRLGDHIDPKDTEDAGRMRMGWNKINFQQSGLQLQNVSGLDWANELLKSGITSRKYSIPWTVPDKKDGGKYKYCSDPSQGSHCIDALFQLNSSGNKLSSSHSWFYARAKGNGNTSQGAVNSTTTIPVDWSRLTTWGDYEGWKRANPSITVKSIRQNGSSNWWNGRFEFSGFQNPFCFKNSSGEGSSKTVSSGGGCVINSDSNGTKQLSLASNAWVDAHKLGTAAYKITLNSGSVFDLHGKNINFSTLSGSGSLSNFGLLSKTASGTATYSADLKGSGRLLINGDGIQTLSGSNSYTGTTTVSKGTLKAGKANAFSASSDTTVEKGATLDLGGTTQTINKLTVKGWESKVENGTLVNHELTNEGQINLTGLSQSQGSITNSGDINLGSGSLKATRLTTSGRLTIQGSAELEKLVNSGGNAIFEDLSVKTASRSNQSIENSAILTIQGSLETSAPVLARGRSTTTITGGAGQTSADVRGLLVGQESNQSGSSSFTLRNGNLDSDFIRIGSEKSSSPSSVTLNNGDVFSHSITIQSGSSLDVGGTIDLFEQEHASGGALELHGTAKAEVLRGSDGDDQVNLDAGSDLNLSGSTSTNLGQCSGGGCDAAINLGPGNDLLITNQATVSIPSGSVIDGGDLGAIVNGEWVGEINVYQNESPGQSPGFEKTDLRNFALINYGGDWETPSGLKGCNFDGEGDFSVTEDRTCLLLEAESPKGNTLTINQGATLRGGVISFDVDGDVSSAQDNVVRLENGNLSAVVVEGRSDVDDDFLLGSDQGGSGALSIELLSGFDQLKQQGGTWTYDIKGYDFGDVPLELQVQSGDVIIDSSADASDAGTGEATFSAISIIGNQESQITNNGELTVTGEKGSGITGNASLRTTSGSTTRLGGSSNYTGETVVEEGASFIALNDFALSDESEHTIRGSLELGEGDGRQLVIKLNLDGGVISEGSLSTKKGLFSSGGEIYAKLTGSSGEGGLITTGGVTTLYGVGGDYSGDTTVEAGTLLAGADGVFSSNSKTTTIADQGMLDLNGTNQSLSDVHLRGGLLDGNNGILNANSVVSWGGRIGNLGGSIGGDQGGEAGGFVVRDGVTIFSGINSFDGSLDVVGGEVRGANDFSFSRNIKTTASGNGILNLRGYQQRIDVVEVFEDGRMYVEESNPFEADSIRLRSSMLLTRNPGGIVVTLQQGEQVAIEVNNNFIFEEGSLVVKAPSTDEPEGVWKIISGPIENVNELAKNTFLMVDDGSHDVFGFRGLGEENAVMGAAVYKGYLTEGSLNLVIALKTQEELFCGLHPGDPDCDGLDLNYPSPELSGSFCPVGESFVHGECVSSGNDEPDLIGNDLPDHIGIELPNVGELPDADGDGLPDVIDEKPETPCKGDECLVGGELPDVDGDGLPDVIDPRPEKPCEGEDCLIGNNLPDTDGDGLPDILDPDDDNDGIADGKDPDSDGDGELDALPGCEEGDDLCDVISDISGDEDDAWEEEEEVASEIIDGLLDGLEEDDIDLPLSFDYGQLARLVGSGFAPRNVDAAGRGLALHNNLLVDTLFERQPLRQFEELVVEERVVEQDVEAADADAVSFVDLRDDEWDLAKRDGVSGWVKGFGGNSRADESSILYYDYDLNAYGTSFGVDVALSETFQIGAYANYGDLNVHQHSGETGGGSWNPDGWGGGLTAQYSTRHFYVQGLLGASEFSGDQSRNILQINNDLGGNTAKGDKSVTSYLGAFRVGAPFKTGGVVLEPQGQVVWTRNHEQGFSETRGTAKNLRLKYKSRTTNFAETELGMKLSVPFRTGERALLVPSVRAAWLADWNQGNEGQEIGYKFTKKTVDFESQLETENGALLEAGLDYTVQNVNGVSMKLYGRGGMEFWASDRGTTWRASGGVTFQF